MPGRMIILVYVSTSEYKQVVRKITPHFASTSLSFFKKNKLIMPEIIVQHADGTQDSSYYGLHGIDNVIEKYGDKNKPDSISHGH